MKNKKQSFLLNQSGQAVVEYLLLVIVSVSLLFLFKGSFTSLNNFMSDFMGEYVVCLMEYGELPSLGVQNTDLKRHTTGSDGRKCEFRKFSASSENGGTSGGGGSGGSNAGGSKNKSSQSGDKGEGKNAANENQSGNSKARGSDSSTGGSSRGGSSSNKRSSPYAQGQIARAGNQATGDNPDNMDDKIKIIEEEEKGRDRSSQNSSTFGGRRNNDSRKSRPVNSRIAQEIEKKSKPKVRKPSSKVVTMAEEGYRFMPYKKTFTPPKIEKPTEVKQEDEDFGVGNLLKWLIIAGIVIACFILFGGQILSYSNSGD